MSIIALALRMSAVRALSNATLSGDLVFDSAIFPIDKLVDEKGPAPFTSVSTEEETGKPTGRDINNGDRLIDLVIETAIANVMPMPGEDGNVIVVAETDANLELSLAIHARQIDAALWGRGGGIWGDVFRAFAKSIEETSSRRGIPTKDGQRFAARQVAYRIRAFAEPEFGVEPAAGTPVAKFLAALAGEPALAGIASIIRNAIMGNPTGWPEHYTALAVAGGLTEDEARKVGIAPLGGYPSAPMSEADFNDMEMTIGQPEVDANLPEEGQP